MAQITSDTTAKLLSVDVAATAASATASGHEDEDRHEDDEEYKKMEIQSDVLRIFELMVRISFLLFFFFTFFLLSNFLLIFLFFLFDSFLILPSLLCLLLILLFYHVFLSHLISYLILLSLFLYPPLFLPISPFSLSSSLPPFHSLCILSFYIPSFLPGPTSSDSFSASFRSEKKTDGEE